MLISIVMRRLIHAFAFAAIVLCILLNLYMNFYPIFKKGCQFSPEAVVKVAAFGDPQIPGVPELRRNTFWKYIDIHANDEFLKQVSKTIHRNLDPDFSAVLGDLLSSQWIDDVEFSRRVERMKAIFPPRSGLINISGNHDIGYHGDFTEERVGRFEKAFGELNFKAFESPEYRIVVINAMSMDGPPYSDKWQLETIDFLNELRGYTGSTVLLMHIPGYKSDKICSDATFADHYSNGNLRSQNHLSEQGTNFIFNAVFGFPSEGGQGGIVLVGHDHEGCECTYNVNEQTGKWSASIGEPGFVVEHTVRSMMAEFGGNTGLVSGINHDGSFKWEFELCRFHVQHIWYFNYILTSCVIVLFYPVLML